MKPRLILLLLAAHAGAALAQYKCTANDGAITIQQTPCFGAKTEEKLTVVPNGHPPPASGALPAAPPARPPASMPSLPRPVPKPAPVAVQAASGTPDQRMLASFERQKARDPLEQNLKTAQDQRSKRAAQLQQDIAAARVRYGDNPVDAPALKDAIAALNERYAAMRVIDDDNVGRAEQALAKWDATPH